MPPAGLLSSNYKSRKDLMEAIRDQLWCEKHKMACWTDIKVQNGPHYAVSNFGLRNLAIDCVRSSFFHVASS